MDIGQWLVIGFCALLLVWFICGAVINYRRAGALLEWLKAGVEELGELGATGWLTALHSAAKLTVHKAHPPFRAVELFFVLEARENLLVWAFRHMLGRRDELFIRAELRSAPGEELEAVSNARRTTTGEKLAVIFSDGKNEKLAERLKPFLTFYSAAILKLSLRRKSPHVFLRLKLDPLRRDEARAFFSALRTCLE